jgi:hypothetical protein
VGSVDGSPLDNAIREAMPIKTVAVTSEVVGGGTAGHQDEALERDCLETHRHHVTLHRVVEKGPPHRGSALPAWSQRANVCLRNAPMILAEALTLTVNATKASKSCVAAMLVMNRPGISL